MLINYSRTVPFSTVIINVGLNADSLITCGQKTTAGAPAATAGKYIRSALIQNMATGIIYVNTGTTASPVWTALETAASGFTLPLAETDATTTTGTSFAVTFSTLTNGIGQNLIGPASGLTSGILSNIDLGTAVTGTGHRIVGTGVYTGAFGVRILSMVNATTGLLDSIVASGLTTGIAHQVTADEATLSTGRYYSANDGANEVFGIGANGHIHSTASADGPTITPTTPNGISAAAITAGGTDTCGVITTTGTQDGSGATVLDVTFGKTYTVAPKAVMLQALNAAGSKASATTLLTAYVSAVSATGFTITLPEDASALATPSFSYLVIA